MPREGAKRTRRTGLKYAPRGGAWAVAGKTKPPVVPRTLKPAPLSQQVKSNTNSQESQASSGLDALGMLASQVLDSQESQHPSSQPKYYPSTQVPSTPYNIPSSPLTARTSHPSHQHPATLLSPLPIPTSKRRRTTSRASDSTIEPDPALTESEISPSKVRVLDDSDEDDDEDDERVRESPAPPPASQGNPYASSLPIPYRTTRSVARELVPGSGGGGPRRKLNFDSKDSELLNHD